MEIALLNDIVVITGLAVAVILFCHKVHVPSIIGFLLTGIVAGPHGLGLVNAPEEVKVLAEIGVIFLLFTIGIEFSLKRFLKIKNYVLLGGTLQLIFTILSGFIVHYNIGRSAGESVFIGFLISLSSTAIVLSLLQERGEVDSPHGRITISILIFQDIAVVPMMILMPFLKGNGGVSGYALAVLIAKGTGIILLAVVAAKWFIPRVLFQVTSIKERSLFLLSIIFIGLAVAWISSKAGLSLALGAFLAGLIISESEYAQQAFSSILPFRDVFTSFFFVSIGMLLDINFFLTHPGMVLIMTFAVIFVKTITGGFAAIILKFPFRTAVIAGLALSQIGEFSFILADAGAGSGLISGNTYQLFLNVSILTMLITPLLIAAGPHAAASAMRLPLPNRIKAVPEPAEAVPGNSLSGHLIIIGFGINGRNLARAALKAGIPYCIIEMNPETVRIEKARGESIFYGDAIQETVLLHAGSKTAKAVVIAVSDPAATRRIASVLRKINRQVYIIARTHFVKEVLPLYELGADEVVPEEFETSIEIFSRLLRKYDVSQNEIETLVAEIRADEYQIFRNH